MTMDWNQDPHPHRLEEKLDHVIKFQQIQKKTNQSIPKLFSLEECKEVLQCSDRTLRYYLFESYKHKLPYLKLDRKILIKECDLSGFIVNLKEDLSKRRLLWTNGQCYWITILNAPFTQKGPWRVRSTFIFVIIYLGKKGFPCCWWEENRG